MSEKESKMKEQIINEMIEYYNKNCKGYPMEYTYGFFDAMSIIREMKEKTHD